MTGAGGTKSSFTWQAIKAPTSTNTDAITMPALLNDSILFLLPYSGLHCSGAVRLG
jgi:hypothetical protein